MSMRVVFTPTDRCRAIQIDAGQIALLPITQVQYSPAVRSPDVWSYTIDAGPAWQNEIVLTPSLLPYQLAANTKYYIRSWVKDAANNLQLYYDTADSRFHLLPTIGGVAQSPLTSDLLEWNPQACVRIQVRAGASGLAMVIADGDVPATISGSGDVRAVTGSVLTIRAGDATGANMLPHYLVTDLDHWE